MRTSLLETLVLLAIATAACNSSQASSSEPTTTERSETASDSIIQAPAEAPVVPIDRALSTAAAYFSAFNSGDANAVMALLPADATFSDSIIGSITRESWERRLAWNLAQGTRLDTPDCIVPPDGASGEGTTVRCESATLNAQIQAVASQPVPTVVSLFVTPNGIRDLSEEYGRPDFLHAIEPFLQWMEAKHPDDAGKIGFGVWDSIDQAERNGKLTAEYVREWAAYLEMNCIYIPDLIIPDRDSYLDDCGTIEQ